MTVKKYILLKNCIEPILSTIIIIIILPLLLLISIILMIVLKSFPIIIQKRGITKENQVFKIYKFKTIKIDSGNNIINESILFKPDLSKYVPPFCKWLRKTGLDELPQIFNIFKCEMSFVGPRPLIFSDLELLKRKYPQHYYARNLIKIKPGIVGMWQVFGNREEGIRNIIDNDLYYCEQNSFSTDLMIVLNAILLISKGKHSDSIFPVKADNVSCSTVVKSESATNF